MLVVYFLNKENTNTRLYTIFVIDLVSFILKLVLDIPLAKSYHVQE